MRRLGWALDSKALASVFQIISGASISQALDGVQLALDGRAEAMAGVKSAWSAIDAFGKAAGAGVPAQFWPDVATGAVEALLVDWLERELPILLGVSLVVGIVEIGEQAPSGAMRTRYLRRHLRWDRIPKLIKPGDLMRDSWHWGDPAGMNHEGVLGALEQLGILAGFGPRRGKPIDELASRFFPSVDEDSRNTVLPNVSELRIPLVRRTGADGYVEAGAVVVPASPIKDRNQQPDGFFIGIYAVGEVSDTLALSKNVSLTIAGAASSVGAIGIEIHPAKVSASLPAGAPGKAEASISLDGVPLVPWIVLGTAGKTHVEVGGYQVMLRAHTEPPEISISSSLRKLGIVIKADDFGNLVSSLLHGKDLRLEMGGEIAWSSKSGLTFGGNASLSITVPFSLAGLAEGDALFQLDAGEGGHALRVLVAASGHVTLGPLTIVIAGLGIGLLLDKSADGRGTLGPLAARFEPILPTGLGLALEAGPVKAAGFLGYEKIGALTRYTGAMQVSVGSLAINAFGILDELPTGFSLLVMLSMEFQRLQLGWGFTLDGVGGLLGVNRTASIDAIREGLRSGAIDSALFPKDLIRNAPQIAKDVSGLFPSAPGRYLFGPMALLGWGTPRLATIRLAVILEVPAPIRLLLLGLLKVLISDEKTKVVLLRLQVNAFGFIDFERKMAGFEASLYDSLISGFVVSGDMALRFSWGENPVFVLSIGGFHPAFTPPSGFPALRRVQISLTSGDNPSLRINTYLAVTSNTVQLGARLELYVSYGATIQGELSFDALLTLSPLSFQVEIHGSVSLSAGGFSIASLSITVFLSGPHPWHARGRVSVSFLFFSASVSFDLTIGDRTPLKLPDAINVAELIAKALTDPRNVTVAGDVLPLLVRAVEAPNIVRLPPLATIGLRERIAPLSMQLDHIGAAPLTGSAFVSIEELRLEGVAPDSATTITRTLYESFAPAQFFDMDDDAKLRAPAFQTLPAGLELSSSAADVGALESARMSYTTRVIDPSGKLTKVESRIAPATVAEMVKQGAVARKRRDAGPPQVGRQFGVGIREIEHVVAAIVDGAIRRDDSLTPKPGSGAAGTWLAASRAISKSGEDRNTRVVVAKYELVK